jgi:hypothetical protein
MPGAAQYGTGHRGAKLTVWQLEAPAGTWKSVQVATAGGPPRIASG